MKSVQIFLITAGLVQAELALYPSRGLPDSICTARPYKQFLPLSNYAPASSFCHSRYPMHTYACTTTTSQDTKTLAYTDAARPTITKTDTIRTTTTVATRTAKAVTICSTTPISRLAKRAAPCTKSHSTLSTSIRKNGAVVAEVGASETITAAPAPTQTLSPAQSKSLSKKFNTVRRWGNSEPDDKRFLSAISACRCIQSNPGCTTSTVVLPARTKTAYPADNKPVTITAEAKLTITVRKTAKVTPTVYDSMCAHD